MKLWKERASHSSLHTFSFLRSRILHTELSVSTTKVCSETTSEKILHKTQTAFPSVELSLLAFNDTQMTKVDRFD